MAKKEISLLPEKKIAGSLAKRLLNWVLSYGRYIIVFTQLIVIGAFLSRFWLDRTNSDLSSKIRQQKAILASAQDFERQFLSFQRRLSAIDKSFQKSHQPLEPLLVIAESMPPDVIMSNYNFSKKDDEINTSIKVQIFSEAGLAEFIDRLLSQETVKSISIGTVEKELGVSGMTLQFSINFSYPD